jgi:hypothetical protein
MQYTNIYDAKSWAGLVSVLISKEFDFVESVTDRSQNSKIGLSKIFIFNDICWILSLLFKLIFGNFRKS